MCLIKERKNECKLKGERKRVEYFNGVKKMVGCINCREKVTKKRNVSSYLGQTKKENVSF